MILNEPYGSKKRLFEMMQKVNKIKLNENVDTDQVLNSAFEKLKTGGLEKENGGNNETTVQSNDNVTNVMINGVDAERNQYSFEFVVNYNEGGEDGTYNINDTQLKHFSFKKPDGSMSYDLDETSLQNFNRQYGSEMFDVVDKYFEIEDTAPVPEPVEENEEKDIMDKSYPFGGGKDDIQKSKNYGDTEPVNPALRVKSKELEQFVEGESKGSSGAASSIFKNLMKGTHDDGTKKKRKTPEKKVDESKEIDNNSLTYLEIFGDQMMALAKKLTAKKVQQLGHEVSKEEYAKMLSDEFSKIKENNVLASMNETNEDSSGVATSILKRGMGSDATKTDKSPEHVRDLINKAHNNPTYRKSRPEQVPDKDDMDNLEGTKLKEDEDSDEPKKEMGKEDLDSAIEKRSEEGDKIQGGLADDDQPDEFDVDQLLMGLEVELEHTDDPMVALEIAMDHLAEIPDYYARLKSMEADAKGEGEKSQVEKDNPELYPDGWKELDGIMMGMGRKNQEEVPDEDSELTDELLGYKPHNVGDYTSEKQADLDEFFNPENAQEMAMISAEDFADFVVPESIKASEVDPNKGVGTLEYDMVIPKNSPEADVSGYNVKDIENVLRKELGTGNMNNNLPQNSKVLISAKDNGDHFVVHYLKNYGR